MRTAEFDARCFPEIPPLAWLLDASQGAERPALYHGRHVDLFENAFFEGAWDGGFSDAAFDRASNVFGSGAKIESGSMRFVTPSHTLESLVLLSRDNGHCVVSNSLAFLCSYSDLDLEWIGWRSGEFFASIMLGLNHSPQALRINIGHLWFVYHHNFVLTPGKRPQFVKKDLPPNFQTFESYYDYLTETTRRVCANASHLARLRRYRPIATLSSGYDSTAAAVVAKSVGCREAVSLRKSQRGEPDTGVAVAEALGLSLREFERPDRAVTTNFSEAEFLSSGAQGEDYVYRAFGDALDGRIVFTGFLGGTMWDKNRPVVDDNLRRGDLSGSSLGEFRLARGFVHLPIPYIGCQRHTDLRRISNSADMARYSVGGTYDKPIARRIVESASVPREAFGQSKQATSLLMFRNERLLSEESRADIVVFCKGLSFDLREEIGFALLAARWRIGTTLFRVFGRLQRLRGGRFKAVKYPRAVGQIFYAALSHLAGPYEIFDHSHPRNAVWQRWAITRVKIRYAAVGKDATTIPSIALGQKEQESSSD